MSTPSVIAVAESFGLAPYAHHYHEITEQVARSILVRVLYRDLAYNTPLTLYESAVDLVSRFLRTSRSNGCRFYTNAEFSSDKLSTWNSATQATFDAGVLVVGQGQCACLWAMDED